MPFWPLSFAVCTMASSKRAASNCPTDQLLSAWNDGGEVPSKRTSNSTGSSILHHFRRFSTVLTPWEPMMCKDERDDDSLKTDAHC
jgi:hypothetical protein